MKILSSEKTSEFLKNIVYLDTQKAEYGLDLTVNKIYEIENRGEIDFGGSERNDVNISEIKPEFRNPDDDYGWWELDPGTYLIEHNEDLKENKESLVQPLRRLTMNGATHPAQFITELKPIPLHVSEEGISIKENSRISRILMFK